MNEVIRQLMERKSVRVYTDQEISPDDKRAILHAAMAAPTAGNQQLYTILDITDEALKQKLSVSCGQPAVHRTGKDGSHFLRRFSKMVRCFYGRRLRASSTRRW